MGVFGGDVQWGYSMGVFNGGIQWRYSVEVFSGGIQWAGGIPQGVSRGGIHCPVC